MNFGNKSETTEVRKACIRLHSIYSSHHWWYNQHDSVKRTIFQKMHFSLVPRDSLSRRSLNRREFAVTLFFSGFVPLSSRYNKRNSLVAMSWTSLTGKAPSPCKIKPLLMNRSLMVCAQTDCSFCLRFLLVVAAKNKICLQGKLCCWNKGKFKCKASLS